MRLLFACLMVLAVWTSAGTAEGRRITVRFAPGGDGARYSGQIVGYDDDRYALDLRGGQTLIVRMGAGQAYFNIAPEYGSEAIYNSSVSGKSYSGVVPYSGRYVIQVYMMRAAARRNAVTNYNLSIRVPAGRPAYNLPSNTPPDFADGDVGGPDRWIVSGVPFGDVLNIRVAPDSKSAIVARVNNQTVLRNLGCRRIGPSRWCRVAMDVALTNRGWVNGHFLREH